MVTGWIISFVGYLLGKFHVSTQVSSHWSSEILKLDDELTPSSEHIHTTDKEQRQTTPSEADKATRQVRAGPLLSCYCGVSVFVHVCVVCVCLCVCLGKGSRWTRGHCCESWEFVRVIQCPLCVLPPLPDWGFQFSREARVKRIEEWKLGPPPPSLLPLSSLFWDKIRTYADDISLFVVENKNHMCLLCKEPGGGVNGAHRPETITR